MAGEGRRTPSSPASLQPVEKPATGIRLQRFLSEAGVASRRQAEAYIAAGRVSVNGGVAELGSRVLPGSDRVTFDGRPVTLPQRVYLALYKPEGYTTSLADRHAAHLIAELVPKRFGRVFPVGRLDRETSGLLLLTNDGELAFKLTHPRFGVEKIYEAWVEGKPGQRHLERMRHGMEVEGERYRANDVQFIRAQGEASLLRITLSEGKKREVRRLFAAIGHPVRELKRIQFASVDLGEMKPGDIRPLTHREVKALHEMSRRGPAANFTRRPRHKMKNSEGKHAKPWKKTNR